MGKRMDQQPYKAKLQEGSANEGCTKNPDGRLPIQIIDPYSTVKYSLHHLPNFCTHQYPAKKYLSKISNNDQNTQNNPSSTTN